MYNVGMRMRGVEMTLRKKVPLAQRGFQAAYRVLLNIESWGCRGFSMVAMWVELFFADTGIGFWSLGTRV